MQLKTLRNGGLEHGGLCKSALRGEKPHKMIQTIDIMNSCSVEYAETVPKLDG